MSSQAADSELSGTLPNLTTLTPAGGGAAELAIKANWIQQMTGPATAGRFPRLTAVSWFDYLKVSGVGTGGSQLLDYRLAEGNPDVESFFRSYLGNVSACPSAAVSLSALMSCRRRRLRRRCRRLQAAAAIGRLHRSGRPRRFTAVLDVHVPMRYTCCTSR